MRPRLAGHERVLHEGGARELVPDAGSAGGRVCGDGGPGSAVRLRDAGYPRVVAVLVDLADLVAAVLVVQLDVVLLYIEPVGDGCELGVVCCAEFAVEVSGEPAAGGVPALL